MQPRPIQDKDTIEEKDDQALVGFLMHSIFGGNAIAVSLVSEYNEDVSITSILADIIGKKSNDSTKEFLAFFKKITAAIPDISKRDLTDPLHLRSVCLLINYDQNLKNIKNLKNIFNGLSMITIIELLLFGLTKKCPVNNQDPITLNEIKEGDSFVAKNGQQFSLSSLINYHNMRDYRGNKGEQYGSKFLLNPLSNEPFLSDDAERIMMAAARNNISIDHLSDTLLPAKYLDSALSRCVSQRNAYSRLSETVKSHISKPK